MKIRSITYFFTPAWPLPAGALKPAQAFVQAAQAAYTAAGYEVETVRLATTPFPTWLPSLETAPAVQVAQEFEAAAGEAGFHYLALGAAQPEILVSYPLVVEMLAATQDVFVCGQMTTAGGGVALPAVRACAGIIRAVAGISPDGFGNLRFAALANVPPLAPFFPAAYHRGGRPAFAIATEAADLAVKAMRASASLADARRQLVEAIEGHAETIARIGEDLSQRFAVDFAGIDFTPGPFPVMDHSVGTALEATGLPAAGLPGGLAAAAFLANALDQPRYPRTGFCGLMLPVLEDATLAQRAAEGTLTLRDLLLYSAVCGTGLDCIPLPGDVAVDALAAVLLDLAALSQRLDKPLTARLMPIPGKQAGDATNFDFAYFANSRVMALEAEPLTGLLAGEEVFYLQPRRR